MPIYEYDCPRCGRFDTLQRMSAPPLRRHEACGSPVKKVMSAGSFSLKGSSKPAARPSSCSAPRGAGCAGCPSAEA
jgi:putative FmdB family regulatory protein